MRVAVNAEQLLYRSPGGIGRYTAQLLTVMPRLSRGDEMLPFTALHRRALVEAGFKAAGVTQRARVLPLPRPVLYDAWHSAGRPLLPRRWGADLVHAPSLAVPPKSRVPLVVTVHDAAPELFPEAFTARGRRFHRKGLAAAARRADLVLTVSASAAEEIVSNSAIDADRIRVVHNGVEPRNVEASRRDEILAGYGLAGRPYVLWVGSLEPRKGVETLVAAARQIRRRSGAPEFRLVLAGYQGWLQPELGGPELDEHVLQTGRVGEDELWALYAGATLFAFPSVHEGFGLPVLEAMSQGTPVLASDIPALREVTGGAAALAPPGDVGEWARLLGDLMDSDEDRARLSAAGRARSAQLTVEAMVTGTREVYRELTGR